jgi:hypothetical protein
MLYVQRQRLACKEAAMDVSEWFTVEFDDTTIRMSADPPGSEAWTQELRWDVIKRICFKAEGFLASDGIYIFTSERPESYVIPVEATGGQELWGKIISRGLFDADLAIQAATSEEGLFCWPPIEEE